MASQNMPGWILNIGFLCGAAILMLTLVSCSGYYMTELINAPVHVTNEWSEFAPTRPLRCDLHDQEVLVTVATPYKNDTKSLGIVLGDGSVVIPELRLVDKGGRQYKLEDLSRWRGAMCYQGRTLPTQTDFAKLMIRSEVPVEVSKITWNCYNFQDHKR